MSAHLIGTDFIPGAAWLAILATLFEGPIVKVADDEVLRLLSFVDIFDEVKLGQVADSCGGIEGDSVAPKVMVVLHRLAVVLALRNTLVQSGDFLSQTGVYFCLPIGRGELGTLHKM